jgi:outer membrane protein TolC
MIGGAQLQDEIIRQVVDSRTDVITAREQLALAHQNLLLALRAFQLAHARKEFGVAEVLEVIKTMQDVNNARAEYVLSITAMNEAQYQFMYAIAGIEGMQVKGDVQNCRHC